VILCNLYRLHIIFFGFLHIGVGDVGKLAKKIFNNAVMSKSQFTNKSEAKAFI